MCSAERGAGILSATTRARGRRFMPRSSPRRHGARTAEKHHELAALHELLPTRTRPYGQKAAHAAFGSFSLFRARDCHFRFSPDTTRIATPPRPVEFGCQDVLIKPRGTQRCPWHNKTRFAGEGMRSSFVEAKFDVSRTLSLIGNQHLQIFVTFASAKLKASSPLSCKRDEKPQHL